MLTLLITDVQKIVNLMTGNFAYIRLNLNQLDALKESYNKCLQINQEYNNAEYIYEGNKISIIDFSVYQITLSNNEFNTITIFKYINLDLHIDKIYQLFGGFGSGKTTFLKAITNNWQYTDGVVKWPIGTEGSIYFIPQAPFVPDGTCMDLPDNARKK